MGEYNGLNGKKAIVTGADDIGRAVSEKLLEEGCYVLVTDPDGSVLLKLKEKIGDCEGRLFTYEADLSTEDGCMLAVKKGVDMFGYVDYLVNNYLPRKILLKESSRDEIMEEIDRSVISYATMISQYRIQQGYGRSGAIVNVMGFEAFRTRPEAWLFNAINGGIDQLTKNTAIDLSPYVRVNSVSHGYCPETDLPFEGSKFAPVSPDEIAPSVAFLLSDEASAIYATNIAVDRGYIGAASNMY